MRKGISPTWLFDVGCVCVFLPIERERERRKPSRWIVFLLLISWHYKFNMKEATREMREQNQREREREKKTHKVFCSSSSLWLFLPLNIDDEYTHTNSWSLFYHPNIYNSFLHILKRLTKINTTIPTLIQSLPIMASGRLIISFKYIDISSIRFSMRNTRGYW